MRVNSEFIELGLYCKTLNKAQFEILGQSYPPNENWKEEVVGTELSTKETNLFLLLRGKLALKAQEQIIKNYTLLATFYHPKKETKHKKSSTLTIYCDGACKGNPGNAGSGLAIYEGESLPRLLYGEYEERGTNNTAELKALYKALLLSKASDAKEALIFCDSKYSIDSITNWAYGWKRKGWKKKGGEIKNLEIIKLAHELYDELQDRVTIKHVKGHSGVEGNELADRMAIHAISSKSKAYQVYHYKDIDEVLRIVSDG